MDTKSKGLSHSWQKNPPGSSQSKGSSSELRKFIPNLTSKLGKDRKLPPQECQCHMDKNLCLFYGTLGHVAKDCPKSMSVASKGRTVKTTQESISLAKPPSADPKKDGAVLGTTHNPRIAQNSLMWKLPYSAHLLFPTQTHSFF